MASREEEATQWRVISHNSRKAAQHLLDLECYRSSVSRSYYAAYAAITAELVSRGLLFAHERSNPDHTGLPAYVLNNLGTLPQTARFEINKALRRLYRARIEADYMAASKVNYETAKRSIRDLSSVFRALGIDNKGN